MRASKVLDVFEKKDINDLILVKYRKNKAKRENINSDMSN